MSYREVPRSIGARPISQIVTHDGFEPNLIIQDKTIGSDGRDITIDADQTAYMYGPATVNCTIYALGELIINATPA